MKAITFKESAHTGGGIYVDLFELEDGRVLGVGDETAVLYPSLDAFHGTAEDIDYAELPQIIFNEHLAYDGPPPGIGTHVNELRHEHVVDLLVMNTGEVLGVNADYVGLYPHMTAFWSPHGEGATQKIDLL